MIKGAIINDESVLFSLSCRHSHHFRRIVRWKKKLNVNNEKKLSTDCVGMDRFSTKSKNERKSSKLINSRSRRNTRRWCAWILFNLSSLSFRFHLRDWLNLNHLKIPFRLFRLRSSRVESSLCGCTQTSHHSCRLPNRRLVGFFDSFAHHHVTISFVLSEVKKQHKIIDGRWSINSEVTNCSILTLIWFFFDFFF